MFFVQIQFVHNHKPWYSAENQLRGVVLNDNHGLNGCTAKCYKISIHVRKLESRVLQQMAMDKIRFSTHPQVSPGMMNKDKPLSDSVSVRWIQRCMEAYYIVGSAQTEKLMVSPTRQDDIDKYIAFYLGVLAQSFHSGIVDENMVENCDVT